MRCLQVIRRRVPTMALWTPLSNKKAAAAGDAVSAAVWAKLFPASVLGGAVGLAQPDDGDKELLDDELSWLPGVGAARTLGGRLWIKLPAAKNPGLSSLRRVRLPLARRQRKRAWRLGEGYCMEVLPLPVSVAPPCLSNCLWTVGNGRRGRRIFRQRCRLGSELRLVC